LLVLDANGVAAEVMRDADGGNVHLALGEDLLFCEVGGVVRAKVELHAFVLQPSQHLCERE